jgi:hypothetical protein
MGVITQPTAATGIGSYEHSSPAQPVRSACPSGM